MAGKRKLEIEILGDAKGVSKAFGDAESASSSFGSKVGKVGKAAGVAFAGVATAVGLAAGAAMKWGQSAADDEAEQALFEKQILLADGSQSVIDAFNEQIAAGMKLKGFTDTELRTAYGQAFAQSQDFATAQSDVALAMDIARTAGVPLEQALDAITKANNGQMRGLKSLLPQYGDLIDAAGSSAEALDIVRQNTDGAADTFANTASGEMQRAKIAFGEVTESIGAAFLPVLSAIAPAAQQIAGWLGDNLPGAIEKAQVWFDEHLRPAIQWVVDWVSEHWPEIKQVVGDVLTAVGEGIEGFVTFIRDAWAEWGDEIMAVINAVWPPIQTIVGGVIEAVRGIIKTVTSLIKGDWESVWNGIKQFFSGIWEAIKGIVDLAITAIGLVLSAAWEGIKAVASAAWDGIKSVISGVWDGIKTTVSTAVDAVVGFVTGIPDRIADTASSMWDGIKDGFLAVKAWLSLRIDDVVGFVTGLPSRITTAASGMWDGIKNAFKGAINWIIDKWNGLEFKIPGFSVFGVDVGGFTLGLPDIPRLHTGGEFRSPVPGGEGLALLRDREHVLTPEQMASAGGGVVVQVSVTVQGNVMTERDLVSTVHAGVLDGLRRGQLQGLTLAGSY